MIELKFRAWEKQLKEIIPVHDIDFERKMINTNSAWRLFDEVELMQYTGLKDKNTKKIYEGDILYCGGWSGVPYLKPYAMPEKNAKCENFIVVKMDCGFVLRHISGFGEVSEEFFYTPNGIIKGWQIVDNYDFWNLQRNFEVIGNIYQNQELLSN